MSDVNNGTITFSVNNTVLKATADFGPIIFIGPTIVITGNDGEGERGREGEGGREGGRERERGGEGGGKGSGFKIVIIQ